MLFFKTNVIKQILNYFTWEQKAKNNIVCQRKTNSLKVEKEVDNRC